MKRTLFVAYVATLTLLHLLLSHGFIHQQRVKSPTGRLLSTRTSDSALTRLEYLQEKFYEPQKEELLTGSYQEKDETAAMINADVTWSDNFWSGTLQRIKKKRLAAMHDKDMQARLDTDKNFIKLMNLGFDRRLCSEVGAEKAVENLVDDDDISPAILSQHAAMRTADKFELGKTKSEQLEDLKRKKLMQRSGLMKLVPKPLQKYVDYLASLRKDPESGDIPRNMAVSAIFAFITMINARARMAFIYSFIGNVAVMSILLTRNMPKLNVPMGMDSRRVVNWSQSAFRTAVGVTALFAVVSGFLMGGLLSVLPLTLSLQQKLRGSMAFSVLAAGYCTAWYEVFEEKGKSGWRWKRALEGYLSDEIQEKLRKQVYGDGTDTSAMMTEEYDFAYDPQLDDYPPLPKYIDEVDGSGGLAALSAGESIDEEESGEHFRKWYAARRDARKAPVMEAESDEPWLGGKKDLFVKNPPKWITAAYKKNVLKANSWRDKPAKYEKDTSEFEPITGPIGFRDKRPEWLDMFGDGIWEEKLSVSRKAARAFGSYRKTMWKVDKEVKLLPCDGADKT